MKKTVAATTSGSDSQQSEFPELALLAKSYHPPGAVSQVMPMTYVRFDGLKASLCDGLNTVPLMQHGWKIVWDRIVPLFNRPDGDLSYLSKGQICFLLNTHELGTKPLEVESLEFRAAHQIVRTYNYAR